MYEKTLIVARAEERARHGFDGVLVRFSDAVGDIAEHLTHRLGLSGATLVYLDVGSNDLPQSSLDALCKLDLPTDIVIASSSGPTLFNICSACGDRFGLVYRLTDPREMLQGPPCPFSAVELPFSLASHDSIRRVHSWAKAVYVRVDEAARRSKEWSRRGAQWLIRERVDVIVYDGRLNGQQ
jgi:hypothetical protein